MPYKKIFTIVFLAMSFNIYGQTIKTPKNQTISVSASRDTPALIIQWEAQAASWINQHSSGAVRKASATSNYNCHAYAWHISDGGDDEDCWLNNIGTNLSKYWTNDAYSITSSRANSHFNG